jgi:ubiquinone/menaquinone biosynthesis C-methylase UbiE
MLRRLFARQFREPTGLLGRLVGNLMARGNEYEGEWTVSLLNIQANDHVLEIGFGPGVSIQRVSQKATSGLVAGIDLSQAMVQTARKRNAAAIQAGRVELNQGNVAALPFGNDSFDKAFAIHSIYFWPKPTEGLRELRRVLKPGGLLAITIRPKDKWDRIPPADIFSLYGESDIEQLLGEAGFQGVHVNTSPQPEKFLGVCVLGVKGA